MEQQQPRRYRIRVYRRGLERLTDQDYMHALDFTDGPGLAATKGLLDALLLALAATDGASGEEFRRYHLRIEEWDTRKHACDWPAIRWPQA